MMRFVCCCLMIAGCTRGPSAAPPAPPTISGVAPGVNGSWEVGQRRYKGVRPIDNPPPPKEPWTEPQLSDAEPRHLGGVPLEGNAPQRISSNVPTSSCRLDGSNHCDNLELERWWKYSGNPY